MTFREIRGRLRVTFFCEAGVATRWSAAIDIAEGADDMNDYNEWISYSHWGMFAVEQKFSS
jgi:hypothetical protein